MCPLFHVPQVLTCKFYATCFFVTKSLLYCWKQPSDLITQKEVWHSGFLCYTIITLSLGGGNPLFPTCLSCNCTYSQIFWGSSILTYCKYCNAFYSFHSLKGNSWPQELLFNFNFLWSLIFSLIFYEMLCICNWSRCCHRYFP